MGYTQWLSLCASYDWSLDMQEGRKRVDWEGGRLNQNHLLTVMFLFVKVTDHTYHCKPLLCVRPFWKAQWGQRRCSVDV